MIVDFGILKAIMMTAIHERFDHKLILWIQDPILSETDITQPELPQIIKDSIVMIPCVPTAEELARFWGGLCGSLLEGSSFDLYSCEVRETPSSIATYYFQ